MKTKSRRMDHVLLWLHNNLKFLRKEFKSEKEPIR